jgi:orotidine-5'-phosphate decarboxylase
MLTASADALANYARSPILTAVTVLTRMDALELSEIGIGVSPEIQVERLAKLSRDCGVDGVVCSAREVGLVKQTCGSDFLTVTPGIRPEGAELGDQKRVMTPPQAQAAGVDYMVIGRPITRAADPLEALRAIHTSLLA